MWPRSGPLQGGGGTFSGGVTIKVATRQIFHRYRILPAAANLNSVLKSCAGIMEIRIAPDSNSVVAQQLFDEANRLTYSICVSKRSRDGCYERNHLGRTESLGRVLQERALGRVSMGNHGERCTGSQRPGVAWHAGSSRRERSCVRPTHFPSSWVKRPAEAERSPVWRRKSLVGEATMQRRTHPNGEFRRCLYSRDPHPCQTGMDCFWLRRMSRSDSSFRIRSANAMASPSYWVWISRSCSTTTSNRCGIAKLRWRPVGRACSTRLRIPRDGEQCFHGIVNTDSTAT